MTASSIRQIKQHIQQLTNETANSKLPSFWLTDWLLYVVEKPAIFLITDEDYQLTDSEFEQFNAGVKRCSKECHLRI